MGSEMQSEPARRVARLAVGVRSSPGDSLDEEWRAEFKGQREREAARREEAREGMGKLGKHGRSSNSGSESWT